MPTTHSRPVRILSLSCVYPNPGEPGLGVFVRSRLQHLAALAELKIIAPVALLDYGSMPERFTAVRGVPRRRWDGDIEVFHPRWIYTPFWGSVPCLFLRLLPVLLRIRKCFPFQVLDAHFGYPEGVVACLLTRIVQLPFTVTLRGSETMHAKYSSRRLLMRWSLRRAGRVIAVSERLRDFAISLGVDACRVTTIPNGIDGAMFSMRSKSECRKNFGIPQEARAVLSAGLLIERKGHHHVIRALRALRHQGVNAELWIVGSSGREDRFERSIRTIVSDLQLSGVVHFLGHVRQETLAELMSAVDILCLASNREGWPNVVHEALACGTPVVATNVGAIPALIQSEEYGLIVPVDDQIALLEALMTALRKTWNRELISAWGRSRTWVAVAAEVLRVFERLTIA